MAAPRRENKASTMIEWNFERQVLPHRSSLYQYALAFTHQADAAEDLVQDTLLRALRAFSSYRAEGEIQSWLFAILRNQFISRYRSDLRGARPVSLEALQNPETVLSREPGPERRVLAALENEALRRAVAELPPRCRAVLVLSDMGGFTYQEIADELGVPIGTVRSRLSSARDRVRRALAAWRPPSPNTKGIFAPAPPGNSTRRETLRTTLRA